MTPEDRMKKLGSANAATPTDAEWLEFRARAHRSMSRRRIAGAVGGLALILAVVGGAYALSNGTSDNGRGPEIAGSPSATPTPSEGSSPHASPTREPDATSETVYLQQWFVEKGTLLVSSAPFEKTETPARDAMEALLRGVPGPLAEAGVFTMIPEGNELTYISITNGTAAVTVTGNLPEDHDAQRRLAYGQIVYTLTQFETVKRVELSWAATDSADVVVSEGNLRRTDYEEDLPPIVVEAPFGGQDVGRTFELSGIANVFEATVSWRLVDEDGTLLQEGFTTATCGSGCWGTFSEEITYEGAERYAILQVFQSSAEDGSPMHMVEVPLNFQRL